MKVGIITFHFAHNQGAVLQCYALQKVLEDSGHSPYVIDYRPAYHAVRYTARKNPFVLANNSWKKYRKSSFARRVYLSCRGFARGMVTLVKPSDKTREKNFEAFINKHLALTARFSSLGKLKKHAPAFDAYISGSDQLWNPELLDGNLDPAYFLNFGSDSVRRITYAISPKQTYTATQQAELKTLCEPINTLSLREHNQTIDEISQGNYTVCIDPTLLLDKDAYASLEGKTDESEPYIFVYGFETSEDLQKAVADVCKRTGYRVINGSPDRVKLPGNVKSVRNYAPDAFLSYIKNAAFVVTNSFHGTAFSIIYEKQFVTVPHTTRGKRMIELLHKIGLSDRLFGSENFSLEKEADHKSAREKLLELRAESLDYLTGSL